MNLPAVTLKSVGIPEHKIRSARLVSGSAVISVDYFKRILFSLRNIFGGNVKSYESLLERARREALLRMKELARERGYPNGDPLPLPTDPTTKKYPPSARDIPPRHSRSWGHP